MEQLQKKHCNNFFGIWTQVLMLLCRIGPKFYSHHGFLVFPLSPLPHKDSLLPLQSRFVGSSTLHLVGPRSKYRGLPSIIFRLGLKIPFPPAKPPSTRRGKLFRQLLQNENRHCIHHFKIRGLGNECNSFKSLSKCRNWMRRRESLEYNLALFWQLVVKNSCGFSWSRIFVSKNWCQSVCTFPQFFSTKMQSPWFFCF